MLGKLAIRIFLDWIELAVCSRCTGASVARIRETTSEFFSFTITTSSSPDYKHVQRVCKHLDAVLCSLSPLLVSGYALFAIRFLVWVCGKEDTTTSKRGRPTPRAVNKGEGSKREHSSRQAHKMWVSSHDLVHIPG
jgi:hypothetical protein